MYVALRLFFMETIGYDRSVIKAKPTLTSDFDSDLESISDFQISFQSFGNNSIVRVSGFWNQDRVV